MADSYLHGFTSDEQRRLLKQADFLAPWVYGAISLPSRGPLLEVGAGVGGQTRHLLSRTTVPIVTVEFDARQVEAQRQVLAEPIRTGTVLPLRADARAMPLKSGSMGGGFICWVLEHVPGPAEVLREVHRALAPGAELVVTEVQNQSFTLLPRDEELGRFWAEVNATQLAFGGDPFVGARLGGLLSASGYVDISIRFVPVLGDRRDPGLRATILEYFHRLLLSAIPAVVAAHGGDETSRRASLDRAFRRASAETESVFLYTFAQATARKPESS